MGLKGLEIESGYDTITKTAKRTEAAEAGVKVKNANKIANASQNSRIFNGFRRFIEGSNPSFSAKRGNPGIVLIPGFLCICKGFGALYSFCRRNGDFDKKADFF